MRDQLPSGEVFEHCTLVVAEDRDVDVAVFAARSPSQASTAHPPQSAHSQANDDIIAATCATISGICVFTAL